MVPRRKALFACLLVVIATRALGAQSPPVADFGAWARANAHAISVSDHDPINTDLKLLTKVIGKARVVALGEPFHGAHEPLATRNRLIRNLVMQHGFTAVALETGLSTSKRLYDYVLGNTSETDSAAATAFSYGFGAFAENRELLRWLRSYNAARPMSRRVAVYGIDLTGQNFPTAYRSLEAVLTYLDRADARLGRETHQDFADVSPNFRADRYDSLPQAEKDRISSKIDDLIASLGRRRPELTAATSPDDYEWALRQAVNAAQDDAFLRLLPPGFTAQMKKGFDSILDDPRVPAMLMMREVAIADNLKWVLDREGSRSRVIFYAHDEHVKTHATHPLPHYSWEHGENLLPAGVYARSLLGADLVVIGTYFGNAEGFPAANHVLPANSQTMDGVFKSLHRPSFLIDLRDLPKAGALAEWFGQAHETRSGNSGNQITLIRPKQAYDAILFIGRLTPSTGR